MNFFRKGLVGILATGILALPSCGSLSWQIGSYYLESIKEGNIAKDLQIGQYSQKDFMPFSNVEREFVYNFDEIRNIEKEFCKK